MKRLLRFAILCVTGILFLLSAPPVFAGKNLVRGGRLVYPKKTHSKSMCSRRKYIQIQGDIQRAAYAARAAERHTESYVRRIAEIPAVTEEVVLMPDADMVPKAGVSVSVLHTEPVSFLTIKFKGIIFDADGTLLDSLPAWEHSASNFLRSLEIEPEPGLDDEMSKLSLIEGAVELKRRYHLEQSPQEIIELTLAPIWEHYLTDIPAKPGVPELLENLHEQGIKIGVATAGNKELVERTLIRLGLRQYIDVIMTCDDVGVGKQSPAVYDATRIELGVETSQTLVIEDSLYALMTARNAGYITAGVAEPLHPVEHAQAMLKAGHYFIHSFADGVLWPN